MMVDLFTSKTRALQERELRGEDELRRWGSVREIFRRYQEEGGALWLFKVQRKYCTLSHVGVKMPQPTYSKAPSVDVFSTLKLA